jgi:iron complex outermembrane receptor protein
VNYQKINTQGISFAVDYRWRSENAKYAKVAVITGLSYSYLDVKSKGSQSLEGDAKLSNYALQNLKNQVCANVNFEFFHTLNVTLAGRYQQRVNYIDYFLLDAKFSYAIQRFNIYAEVNNLTDVQYIEAAAVPMPGRWVTLGLKWAWWK